MKHILFKLGILLLSVLIFFCNNNPQADTVSEQETKIIFPKGEKIVNDNFTGTAWLTVMVVEDSVNQNSVGNVSFEPGARTNWHLHPNGQIILALGGEGYYQEKGQLKEVLRKGDVRKCPANVPHWHGASPEKEFVQVAITSRISGPTEWLEPVSNGEYTK